MALDRNTPFALQIHGVQRLLAQLAQINRLCRLQDAVRQRGLAVVNVRDNAEVADVLECDFFHAFFRSKMGFIIPHFRGLVIGKQDAGRESS